MHQSGDPVVRVWRGCNLSAFGKQVSHSNFGGSFTDNDLVFLGQKGCRDEPALGTTQPSVWTRARWLDTKNGRYRSDDPIRDDEDNFYRYVGNDPANRMDVTGLQEQKLCADPPPTTLAGPQYKVFVVMPVEVAAGVTSEPLSTTTTSMTGSTGPGVTTTNTVTTTGSGVQWVGQQPTISTYPDDETDVVKEIYEDALRKHRENINSPGLELEIRALQDKIDEQIYFSGAYGHWTEQQWLDYWKVTATLYDMRTVVGVTNEPRTHEFSGMHDATREIREMRAKALLPNAEDWLPPMRDRKEHRRRLHEGLRQQIFEFHYRREQERIDRLIKEQ